MPAEHPVDRFRIAQKLLAARNSIAQNVSDLFFENHPDWLVRYGERGRQFCTDDIKFHLDFLAGAVEGASPDSFADYTLWTTRMLEARGIRGHSLDETLTGIGSQLASILSPEEYIG